MCHNSPGIPAVTPRAGGAALIAGAPRPLARAGVLQQQQRLAVVVVVVVVDVAGAAAKSLCRPGPCMSSGRRHDSFLSSLFLALWSGRVVGCVCPLGPVSSSSSLSPEQAGNG